MNIVENLRKAVDSKIAIGKFLKVMVSLLKSGELIAVTASADYIQFYSQTGDFGIVIGRLQKDQNSVNDPPQTPDPSERVLDSLRQMIPDALYTKGEDGSTTLTLFLSREDKQNIKRVASS